MDDIAVNSAYARHSPISRRKRKNKRDDGLLIDKITRQLVASIAILFVVILAKSINTPATNYVSNKIKSVSVINIEIKSIYGEIEKFIKKYTKTGRQKTEDDASDSQTSYEGSDVFKPEDARTGSASGQKAGVGDSGGAVNEISKKYSFAIPVNGVLSSPFGMRKDPATGDEKLHTGIDIETYGGSLIRAALDGTVLESGSERAYGNYIRIKHDDGIETVYANCSKLIAEKGQKVKKGDVVARMGDAVISAGTHLHFEIWKDGKVLDPLKFIAVQSE